MGLSVEQQLLVESRVANESKSTGLAYLLWFFLGGLGVHRFYVGSYLTGLMMLALVLFGLLLLLGGSPVGVFLLLTQGMWLLLDMFFIPGLVREDKRRIRARMAREVGGA